MEEKLLKKHIGTRIKSFRKQNNLTQNDFCEIINLEQNNLSNIENGKTFPDIKTLFAMIEYGKINPNFLLGFLNDDKDNKYSNIDFELLNSIINLPTRAKESLKEFLKSLNE